VSEEVRLLEIIAQKDAQNRLLQAENERQSQEIKLLKEKIDLLIRRLFGSKSEKLDAAQLELLLKEDALGKADASDPGNGKTGQGYLWVAHRPGEDVLFEWYTTREAKCLDKLIPLDFSGTIQCDGYSAYDHFARHRASAGRPVLLAGCWAHARRGFCEALDAARSSTQSSKAAGVTTSSPTLICTTY